MTYVLHLCYVVTVHDPTCLSQEGLESQRIISLLTELLSRVVQPPFRGTLLKKNTDPYLLLHRQRQRASLKGIITLMLAESNYWKGNQVSQTGWSVAFGTVMVASIARVLVASSAG